MFKTSMHQHIIYSSQFLTSFLGVFSPGYNCSSEFLSLKSDYVSRKLSKSRKLFFWFSTGLANSMNENKHVPTVELTQERNTKLTLPALCLIIHNSTGQEK